MAVVYFIKACPADFVLRCERFVQANCEKFHVRGEWYEMTEEQVQDAITNLTPGVAQVVAWHEAAQKRMKASWEARDRARIEKAAKNGK